MQATVSEKFPSPRMIPTSTGPHPPPPVETSNPRWLVQNRFLVVVPCVSLTRDKRHGNAYWCTYGAQKKTLTRVSVRARVCMRALVQVKPILARFVSPVPRARAYPPPPLPPSYGSIAAVFHLPYFTFHLPFRSVPFRSIPSRAARGIHTTQSNEQIGLLKNDNVPDLVPCLLPRGYPAACHRFLRKWLLLPPSYPLADSAHKLCRQLASPDQVREGGYE